jgi:hypothetical protein
LGEQLRDVGEVFRDFEVQGDAGGLDGQLSVHQLHFILIRLLVFKSGYDLLEPAHPLHIFLHPLPLLFVPAQPPPYPAHLPLILPIILANPSIHLNNQLQEHQRLSVIIDLPPLLQALHKIELGLLILLTQHLINPGHEQLVGRRRL